MRPIVRKFRAIEAQLLAWLALAAGVVLLIVGVIDPLFIAPLQYDRAEQVRMTEAERRAVQDISRGEMLARVHSVVGARSAIRNFELPAHAGNAAAAELLQTVQSILLASTRHGTGCVSLSESPLHAHDPDSTPYRTARISVVMSCGTDDLAKVLVHIEGSHPLLIVTTLDAYQAPVVNTTPGTIPRPLEAHLIVEGFWQPSLHP